MKKESLSFALDAVATDEADASKARRLTYTLHYEEDALGLPKRIEFEADSPATALEIAMGEAAGRRALLLADGEPLCQLVKAAADPAPYWIVARGSARDYSTGGAAASDLPRPSPRSQYFCRPSGRGGTAPLGTRQ